MESDRALGPTESKMHFIVTHLTIAGNLSLILATLIFVYVSRYYWKRWEFFRLASKIPGPMRMPIFGNIHIFFGRFEDFLYILSDVLNKYGDPTRLWLGHKLCVLISEPDHLRLILNSAKALNKGGVYHITRILVGNGLFSAPADIWKRHRKSLAPTFNPKLLNGYVPIFYKNAVALEKLLVQHLGKVFDASIYVERYTLLTVCETSMGIESIDTRTIEQFSHLIAKLLGNMHKRILKPLYGNDFIFFNSRLGRETVAYSKQFHAITMDIIEKKKLAANATNEDDYCSESEKTYKPFLEVLLNAVENGEIFSDDEMKDEVNTLLVAGVDTVATAINFVLMTLAMHPHAQETAYREAVDVLGADGAIECTDLPRLQYIERCISETLRLFPVGPIFVRKLSDDVEIGGKTVPKGADIIMCALHTHRSAKYWPDPLRFDPDRFLPEQVAKRHPYAYVPFSAGPRNCIGLKYGMMALKTYVAHLIRKFKVTTPYERIEDVKVMQTIIIRPAKGYALKFELRK